MNDPGRRRVSPSLRVQRRRRTAARLVAFAALLVVTGIVVSSRLSPTHHRSAATGEATTTHPEAGGTKGTFHFTPTVGPPAAYTEVAKTSLPMQLEDPAAGAFANDARLAGGLDAADTSTADVVAVSSTGGTRIGRLPLALHDAAGAALGDSLYVFGGGDSAGQLDGILRVDRTGAATQVGTLPAASSDSSAAVIGKTAYVIGGYTGTRWLDTIIAFTPGSGAHVVAHLPTALRYAAVASVGNVLVIAGGSTPIARANSEVYQFDPRTSSVVRIGDLPTPLTHASAAASGREALVVGGQDSGQHAVDTIIAIDPRARRVRTAGHLLQPRSDAAALRIGANVWVIGGHNSSGALSGVSVLRATAPVHTSNVYAHDGANALTAVTRTARSLVYVPNSRADTVDVIDQQTMKIVNHFDVGGLPQHVTPAWDLKTLYVDNDHGNSLTPIDPTTGAQRGPAIPVTDPYNLYFTPDGRYAIVVAEAQSRLDFRDPHSMTLVHSLPVPCRGVDHMDFTADGSFALASCEFSGNMLVVDVRHQRVEETVALPRSFPKPQDVKLSPDGSLFYVADMTNAGVWEIDARTFTVVGFLPTGAGAHGLYPSRDAKLLYVSNRDAGTVSVVDFATRAIVRTWTIPGGSPDMGGVSADGSVLWLSGRYDAQVYAISTSTGRVIARIPVGAGPHGLCVWPQPGRYSLGHTGVMR